MTHDNIPHSDPLRSPVVYYVYQVLTSKLLDLLKLPLALKNRRVISACHETFLPNILKYRKIVAFQKPYQYLDLKFWS
jgi:hypothetical protein